MGGEEISQKNRMLHQCPIFAKAHDPQSIGGARDDVAQRATSLNDTTVSHHLKCSLIRTYPRMILKIHSMEPEGRFPFVTAQWQAEDTF